MAHKFSNFADAYTYLETRWSVAQSMYGDALDMCDNADDAANAGDFKWGIRWAVFAIKAAMSAADILLQNYAFSFDQSVFTECYYWASQEGGDGDPYVLTAKKICEAWAKDGFEDRALTIAFIDRQRQLIWDEPFYVAWAAKPKL